MKAKLILVFILLCPTATFAACEPVINFAELPGVTSVVDTGATIIVTGNIEFIDQNLCLPAIVSDLQILGNLKLTRSSFHRDFDTIDHQPFRLTMRNLSIDHLSYFMITSSSLEMSVSNITSVHAPEIGEVSLRRRNSINVHVLSPNLSSSVVNIFLGVAEIEAGASLVISAQGASGKMGEPGATARQNGLDATCLSDATNGHAGGNGGNGGRGGDGGIVTLSYSLPEAADPVEVASQLIVDVSGGPGGSGGAGGRGSNGGAGIDCLFFNHGGGSPGPNGQNGLAGPSGNSGTVIIL